jgi:predicted ribosome quality control (RQC) complex YloA/Tae2 family protein
MKIFVEDDIEICVASSAQENWDLLKSSDKDHMWFHLNKITSPYVVIKHCNPPYSAIIRACELCKEYSKWNGSVKVIYTHIRNVSKGDKIGQAVVKGKTNFVVL